MTALKLGVLIAMVLFLATGLGQAQPKAADCPQPSASVGTSSRPPAPEKIEGTVTKIDLRNNAVTVKSTDGSTHEFRGDPETVRDLKVGDRIDVKLRASRC
jgi:hypothetical protein